MALTRTSGTVTQCVACIESKLVDTGNGEEEGLGQPQNLHLLHLVSNTI